MPGHENGRRSQRHADARGRRCVARPARLGGAAEPAPRPAACEPRDGVPLDVFYAHMPTHEYIFAPTRELWPAASVNGRIGPVRLNHADGEPVCDEAGKPKIIPASRWLDRHRAVEQMTWAPGLPMIIRDRLISDGGWIDHPQAATFNLYRPPATPRGNAALAGRGVDHVERVFGDEARHIVRWLAHRVQRPQEKINHALVLGGSQGIGKDTLLEPVKQAVGPWNVAEVSPKTALDRFTAFHRSVILRISEARDLGEVDRFSFYDHLKTLAAAPPPVLRVNEKNRRENYVPNVNGVIITTNHKRNRINLPPE